MVDIVKSAVAKCLPSGYDSHRAVPDRERMIHFHRPAAAKGTRP